MLHHLGDPYEGGGMERFECEYQPSLKSIDDFMRKIYTPPEFTVNLNMEIIWIHCDEKLPKSSTQCLVESPIDEKIVLVTYFAGYGFVYNSSVWETSKIRRWADPGTLGTIAGKR
jgi:hypothetical protein